MENKITSLIFDFDGVIADTDSSRFKILKSLLEKRGINLNENIHSLEGLSTKSFLKYNFPKLKDTEINEIIKQRHEKFISDLEKYCIPFEGMKETLYKLYKCFDLYIVTTNSIDILEKQLDYLGISGLFKLKIGREHTENKDLLKTYKAIPKIINKRIDECIVIEDSKIGIEAAKSEGYFCIKFNPNNNSFNSNEDIEIRSYEELLTLLKKYTARQQCI